MLLIFSVLSVFAFNVLTPGASFVLIVQNSMAHGRRSGYAIAAGLATADTLFAIAASAGLASALLNHNLLLKGISFCGGLWLTYGGGLHLLLKGKNTQLTKVAESTRGYLSPWLGLKLGLTAGALNPQTIIFFSTMFLAAMASGPTLQDAAVLTVGVACVSLAARCGLVRAMTSLRVQEQYLGHKRKVEAVSGGALVFFGAKVAVPAATLLAASVL